MSFDIVRNAIVVTVDVQAVDPPITVGIGEPVKGFAKGKPVGGQTLGQPSTCTVITDDNDNLVEVVVRG